MKVVGLILLLALCLVSLTTTQRLKSFGTFILGQYRKKILKLFCLNFLTFELFPAVLNSSKNKTYYVSLTFKADWMGAVNFCRTNGMEIMTVESQEESENFIKLCDKNAGKFDSSPGWISAFVGGAQYNVTTKTIWNWYQSGKRFNSTIHWAVLEPNNNAGATESCMAVNQEEGYFGYNDVPCYEKYDLYLTFICQKIE